jgi:hypothetical protein
MRHSPERSDLLARRLMRAAEEDLRSWLVVARLDHELLGALYLRLLEVIERSQVPDDDTVEELALAIYLTASAWQTKSDAPVDLLVSLRSGISKTLSLPRSEIKGGSA